MPSAPTTSTSLKGADGASWLRDHGVTIADASDLQLFANEIVGSESRLARIWHSRVDAEVTVPENDSALVLLQIEGTSVITLDGWSRPEELHPGGLAVFPRGSHFSMTSTGGVARYEATFDLTTLPQHLRAGASSGLIENDPPTSYRQLVVGAANTALSFELDPSESAFPGFLKGFTWLVHSLLQSALEGRAEQDSSRASEHYRRSLHAIESSSTDPGFTVATLASTIGVSPRYLRQVFAQHGTTPHAALREERLRTARSYVDSRDAGARRTRDEIARLSGFPDARTLRRAFEAHAAADTPNEDG